MSAPTLGPYWTAAGKRRSFGKLSTWAEDGLIFCEWQEDGTANKAGDAEVLDIQGAEGWVKNMLNDLAIWDRAREGAPTPKDRAYAIEYFHTLKGHLEVLTETIRDARDQGDQNDPEVRKSKLLGFLRSRRAGMNSTEGLGSASSIVESLIYPVAASRPLIFPMSSARPISVVPPELPPNWGRKST